MPGTSYQLTESRPGRLELTPEQAQALADLGRRLAGKTAWWGATDEGDQVATSAIRVRHLTHNDWEVRVNDAVGVIGVNELVITVVPKIPTTHLLGLFAWAEVLPRLDSSPTSMSVGTSLWDLITRWYVASVEQVLRRDLIRDYRPSVADLPYARGHIDVKRTALMLAGGRARVRCEFEDVDLDNALNRVLLAASQLVAGSPTASADSRVRAARNALRFPDVSLLRREDLAVACDRRTAYYKDAILLAKTILAGTARDLNLGPMKAWSFLMRTPEPVESGIRALLNARLPMEHTVRKKGLQLKGSTKTLNPDLVFDNGTTIGDVKYKRQGPDWPEADLYQIVAFATGYRARDALMVTFSSGLPAHDVLHVGDVHVTNVCWKADPRWTIEEASGDFVDSVRQWLEGSGTRSST